MRKWLLLTSAAAIAIAIGAIVARCLSVPYEIVTFRYVDAITGRPLPVNVTVTEVKTPYFPAMQDLLIRIGFALPKPKQRKYCCPDGVLAALRLAKHPSYFTALSWEADRDHQPAFLVYENGTNHLDSLLIGGVSANWPVLFPTNGIVIVPLNPYIDSELR